MQSLIFPGQGSQVVGMGSEFYKNFDLVRKIFDQADEKLKYSISKIILDGPDSELQLTKNTQPAILTVSYSIFRVLKDQFNFSFKQVNFIAGHSLGEYSALVCSNSLVFEDALYLLYERGKAMQEAVPVGEGSMLAVLGLNIDDINKIILENKDKYICEIANDNAKGQVIISGHKQKIERFQKIFKEKKIKSIPLRVSAPFHCSLMKPAAEKMREKINDTKFQKPEFKIVNNVTAKVENDPENIKDLLIKQIFSTVKWRETLKFMDHAGTTDFIEIGPGKALSGMVKRTINNKKSLSINSINDIKNLEDELKK